MDIFKLLDRPIAFHRVFAELAGSIAGGVLLSQAVYWSRRSSTGDGWFYKSREEWEEETFLTRWEQESARATLREIGVLEESLRSMPRRLFFRINFDRLGVLLLVEKPPASRRKNLQQAGGKTSSKLVEKPPALIRTEITTETTQRFLLSSASPNDQKNKKKCVVNFSEFEKEILDDTLRAWSADIAPNVPIEAATVAWIEYHQAADTEFRNKGAIISTWKGWMRNAQKFVMNQAKPTKGKAKAKANERQPDYESLRAAGLL